jgi:ABC-type transport system involved in multi-copper enzyme maturation permease subunit
MTVALTVVIVLTGAVSLLAAPSDALPPGIATVYYFEGGAYHLIAYLYDRLGNPVTGTRVDFGSPQSLPAGSTTSDVTGPDGIARGAFPVGIMGNYTFSTTATTSTGTTTVATEVSNWPTPPPAETVSEGYGDLVPVHTGVYSSTGQLLVFFAGSNGTAPQGYVVQYSFAQFDQSLRVPGAQLRPLDPTTNYSITALTGFHAVHSVAIDTAAPDRSPAIFVELLDPQRVVVAFGEFAPSAFGPQPTLPPAGQAAELVLTELGLVATVAGLLTGLALYGSDRVSGFLDPYLARPVTAAGFLSARYLGLLLPLSMGMVLGILLGDVGLSARYGEEMPAPLLAVAIASALAALAAWLGVAFALAHLMRTATRLATATLAVLVVFAFLWTPALVTLAPVVGAPTGSANAGHLFFDASVVNPAQAPAALVPPALLGVDTATAVGIAVVAALWILIPLAVALMRARRSD